MKALELKVHPPLVLLFSFGLAYLCSHYLPFVALPTFLPELFWYVGAAGVLIALSGVWQFRLAKTTIDPTKPHKTRNLVSGGVYRITRNPMYLGMVFVIVAAILKLGNYYGFIAPSLLYALHHPIPNQTRRAHYRGYFW